ncbi:hypothetical protein HanRHA438_Chr09g0393411 [Helianthus annuus]|nr:hypothetical protein HanRHA438_Chr09g0393411 [Helianthus annuus]
MVNKLIELYSADLEERGLRWVKTSVARRNHNIDWGDQTDTSWSSDLVLSNFLTDFLQVTLGEDQTNISLYVHSINKLGTERLIMSYIRTHTTKYNLLTYHQ